MADDLDDPALGRLRWYEDDGQWVADVDLAPGHPIEVIVKAQEGEGDLSTPEGDPGALLPQARAWLDRVRRREPEYRAWTAERLVGRRWNRDEPMTAGDIAELLRLLSIVCDPDGMAELSWDDDDRLYGGHAIVTRLGADGNCAKLVMR